VKRQVEPATARRAAYPRLSALVVGAAPFVAGSAFADVTPPVTGQTVHAPPVLAVAPPPPQPPPQPSNPPPPDQPAPPAHIVPPLRGKIACPRPPKEPAGKTEPKANPKKKPELPKIMGDLARAEPPSAHTWRLLEAASLEESARVVHPHGPDEPCQVAGRRA
jgi:hypothetical protein